MSAREFQDQVWLILQTLDVRSTIDIVLLAAGFLLIYRTFRPTGGFKIFAAVLAGTALFGMARLLQFRALGWIFENFRDVIILLLVVVFQPEIRRMFERVASLRRRRLFREPDGFARAFAGTVFRLAEKRTGAHFVFPGLEDLSGLLSGGFRAFAAYSDPLIQSIFDPHTPGHDGAVLMEGDRVRSFGLRLPLSESGKLAEDLGTRHHAAMGLAERTDALVLAVSEERGTVTSFRNGNLMELDEPEKLERLLEQFLSREKPIWTWTRFLPLGFQGSCALLLAFLFWSAVVFSDGRIRRTALEVPVEFVGRPAGLVLADPRGETVRLEFSGTRESLSTLRSESLRLRLDLAGRGPGRHVLAVRSGNLDLPEGVKLLQAEPGVVPVSLVTITEKAARIEPIFAGRLPENLELLVAEIEPDFVAVYFARDTAGSAAIPVIKTRPIDVSRIREGKSVRVELQPPAQLKPVEGNWPLVRVRLEVVPRGESPGNPEGGPAPEEEREGPPEKEPLPAPSTPSAG